MKNFSLIVICFLTFFSTLNAQQVSNKNWTLVHERTATWCPFCGSWGWTMKDNIFSSYENTNVLFMAVHHSGDLVNQTATEFGNNFTGSGQPIFYMDGSDMGVNSGNVNSKIGDIKVVNDFKGTQSVFAGVGIDASLNSNTKTLAVKAKVEFFNAVESGDYYLGLYLLEDVQNIQANRTGLQTHRNVLRQSLLPSTFGNQLKNGAVAKGTTFNVDANLANVTAPRDKIKVAAVIWTKVSGKYIFFNANVVNVGIPASADFEEDTDNQMVVSQRDNDAVNIELKNISIRNSGTISISDMSGRVVASRQILPAEITDKISLNGNYTTGLHVITFISDQKKISKKVMLF